MSGVTTKASLNDNTELEDTLSDIQSESWTRKPGHPEQAVDILIVVVQVLGT